MATYAIGDIQGCYETFEQLLGRIAFDRSRDRLWLVGDLVNRGPRSLDVLRFLRELGPAAISVLGNHDLHLLARASGLTGAKRLDTLDDVLAAPDRDELMAWLAARPLLYREGDWVLVHAGLHPQWTLAEAESHARRIEDCLRDPRRRPSVIGPAGFEPALRVLTTIRTCHDDGTLCKFHGPLARVPVSCRPWFSHPGRRTHGVPVVFGHWAALGYQRGDDYLALDSGCVWGGALTAVCLEDGKVYMEPAREKQS